MPKVSTKYLEVKTRYQHITFEKKKKKKKQLSTENFKTLDIHHIPYSLTSVSVSAKSTHARVHSMCIYSFKQNTHSHTQRTSVKRSNSAKKQSGKSERNLYRALLRV